MSVGRRLARAEAAVAGMGLRGPCGVCGGEHRTWRDEARRHLNAQLGTPEAGDEQPSCMCAACCGRSWLHQAAAAVQAAVDDPDELDDDAWRPS